MLNITDGWLLLFVLVAIVCTFISLVLIFPTLPPPPTNPRRTNRRRLSLWGGEGVGDRDKRVQLKGNPAPWVVPFTDLPRHMTLLTSLLDQQVFFHDVPSVCLVSCQSIFWPLGSVLLNSHVKHSVCTSIAGCSQGDLTVCVQIAKWRRSGWSNCTENDFGTTALNWSIVYSLRQVILRKDHFIEAIVLRPFLSFLLMSSSDDWFLCGRVDAQK